MSASVNEVFLANHTADIANGDLLHTGYIFDLFQLRLQNVLTIRRVHKLKDRLLLLDWLLQLLRQFKVALNNYANKPNFLTLFVH